MKETKELFDAYREKITEARKEFHKRIIGQDELFDCILICLFSQGLELSFHILLEAVPGLAKTVGINTISKIFDIKFGRVTMTPDKMPSEIIGFEKLDPKTGKIDIKKGPIHCNLFMVNEINRASGKVQSGLLEAMQEGQVTIGDETFVFDQPFLVMADQNPLEHRDTYPLGEAQLDRFLMKLKLGYPTKEEEIKIARLHRQKTLQNKIEKVMNAQEILAIRNFIDENLFFDEILDDYAIEIVRQTRPEFAKNSKIIINGEEKPIEELIECGASPRASNFLGITAKVFAFLDGRDHVVPADIEVMAQYIIPHRLVLQPAWRSEKTRDLVVYNIVKEIINKVAANERPKIQ